MLFGLPIRNLHTKGHTNQAVQTDNSTDQLKLHLCVETLQDHLQLKVVHTLFHVSI